MSMVAGFWMLLLVLRPAAGARLFPIYGCVSKTVVACICV